MATTRAAEVGEPGGLAYARKHARWHIAHVECLPREDYGDGHFGELWTLYAPDFPRDFRAMQQLADHLFGKRWMPYTDLALFLAEAFAGVGRWAPRVGQESA
ncbi:hypothetical protein [Enterococcus hirae]|uniref:hypothetical protein n=1 Tax=Enterococcus hirae TaxID=1354 RepID=UPI00136AE6E9|nr:hypothetical protein [Enterococcus hirae]NAE18211.1 hypothetical protein [Enterococcus hirae]